ncbi:hypothetical protein C8R44DRAFT_892352 [Mycena epipterygia]|nr:hypothetical protein C8R44DRAFT_892352 [Mycena epipterygia]
MEQPASKPKARVNNVWLAIMPPLAYNIISSLTLILHQLALFLVDAAANHPMLNILLLYIHQGHIDNLSQTFAM